MLVAALHVAFLYWAYRTRFFGFALPPGVTLTLWLGASSAVAFVSYYFVTRGGSRHRTVLWRGAVAGIATLASLYLGVFLAFNSYGT